VASVKVPQELAIMAKLKVSSKMGYRGGQVFFNDPSSLPIDDCPHFDVHDADGAMWCYTLPKPRTTFWLKFKL